MIVGRILGWLLLIAALVMLGGDLLLAWQTGHFTPAPFGAVIYRLSPGALSLAQAAIQRHVLPALWDDVLLPLLQWPGWVDLGVPGLILLVLCRRRDAKHRRRFGGR